MTISAVILAAGFGTRLGSLTLQTPKPLLRIGDRPVVSHLVERLSEVVDLDHIVVVVNDRHREQWDHWQQIQPAQPEVRIVSNGVTSQADRVGAVADLATGIKHLSTPDWIIVLAGDNLFEESLQAHVDAAVTGGHPIVLCRDLGAGVPPGRFGEITVDDRQVITRFREKPVTPESPLAATCSYVLPGGIGTDLASYLVDGDADSPGSFVGWLTTRRPVVARALTSRYFDIGNHETLAQARAAYCDD